MTWFFRISAEPSTFSFMTLGLVKVVIVASLKIDFSYYVGR